MKGLLMRMLGCLSRWRQRGAEDMEDPVHDEVNPSVESGT